LRIACLPTDSGPSRSPLTAKLNNLTIKVDRPELAEEEAKKLERAEAIAIDGNPIHQVQGGPH
jgi:arylsulfatase